MRNKEIIGTIKADKPLTFTQRELGAYYTSKNLTEILSKWAIRSPKDFVLEPSFGGCGFLQSAVRRLAELGNKQPQMQLYGCDIDPNAFEHLSVKINTIESINKRFLHKDFLLVSPDDFEAKTFDTIIGNPPYISLHNLSADQLFSVKNWIATSSDIKLSKRASLWAYFLLHSISFLKKSGRMAWVLPNSFLQSYYGIQVQQILLDQFGKVVVYNLGERAFLTEGTDERTLILLCDEYGKSSQNLDIKYCELISDLGNLLGDSNESLVSATNLVSINNQVPHAFMAIAKRDDVSYLGDMAKVLIGTVTGANKFFILSQSQVDSLKLESKYLNPILSKFSYIQGLEITKDDYTKWRNSGHRCWIFHVENESEMSINARVYSSTFHESLKNKNETFKKRSFWLAADDKRIPDAFLSYMNNQGPRLALNSASINSTNTIHRLFFKDQVTLIQKKLIAISMCTTFSQLSAEIEGRSYGSGVLKLEPTEAKKIKVVLPKNKTKNEINQAFTLLDQYSRSGNTQAIQLYADDFIFGNDPAIQNNHFSSLRQQLIELRRRRNRVKSN